MRRGLVLCLPVIVAGCSESSTALPDAGAESFVEAAKEVAPESPEVGVDAPRESAGEAGADVTDSAVSYATTFDLVEAPISERGAWTHLGLDWTFVDTEGGVAFGTQTGNGGYDDSYAHLSGFPPDHEATGVIHKIANIDPACTHEVEIHMRWSDGAHDAHGYECNLAWDGAYAEIVRWNGKLGDFTYLARGSVPGGVKDGDSLSCSSVGDTIVLSHNGIEVVRAKDAMFADGNPGMGFWRGGACGTRGDYGFTSYAARSR
jgi:hypothetical protein